MSFSQWLFSGIDNLFKAEQWGLLHIGVMLSCIMLIVGFCFAVKHSHDRERTRKRFVYEH